MLPPNCFLNIALIVTLKKYDKINRTLMVYGVVIRNGIINQNPSLLLSLDLSTYSWMCSLLTGSSTASLTLKEAYLEGSKSFGLWWRAPFCCFH
jgi:hypothetical protein